MPQPVRDSSGSGFCNAECGNDKEIDRTVECREQAEEGKCKGSYLGFHGWRKRVQRKGCEREAAPQQLEEVISCEKGGEEVSARV